MWRALFKLADFEVNVMMAVQLEVLFKPPDCLYARKFEGSKGQSWSQARMPRTKMVLMGMKGSWPWLVGVSGEMAQDERLIVIVGLRVSYVSLA